MGNPVKVIQPGGKLVECEDTDSGYQKALKGIDGWSLPSQLEPEPEPDKVKGKK